jgi:hypothetical protein
VTAVGTTLVIGEPTRMLSALTEALAKASARQFTVVPLAVSSSVAPSPDRVASEGHLGPLETGDHDSWIRTLIDVPSIDWLVIGPSQPPRRPGSAPSDSGWESLADQAAYFTRTLAETADRMVPLGACLLLGPLEHPQRPRSRGTGLLVEGFAQAFGQPADSVRVNAIRSILDADLDDGDALTKGAEDYRDLITAAEYLLRSRMISGQTLSVRLP